MPHIYDKQSEAGVEYWFIPDGGEEYQLDQDNCFANFHRDEKYKDRFCVLDEVDGGWFQWWRHSESEESFSEMEDIALAVGSVLMRNTATVEVNSLFEQRFLHFTDQDWQRLEGETA